MGLALTELKNYIKLKMKQAIKVNPKFAEAYNNLEMFIEKIKTRH